MGLSIKNIEKKFGDIKVLENIDFHIQNGEFIVILGKSGCGKSTLLRILAGLETACDGKIVLNDKRIDKLPAHKRPIGMVFQNYALYPHMNVYQNMAFGLKNQKIHKDIILERIERVSKILEITHLWDRKPSELSGGQRQRVAMGRCIVKEPKLYLFDEPLSNLDAQLRHKMRIEIKNLHKRLGTTSVFVTHDQTEAMTMADRIVIMNNGHIEQFGTPSEIYQKPKTAFVASFIGNPPMQMAKIKELADDNSLVKAVTKQNKEHHHPDKIIGIRPENICLRNMDNKDSINADIGGTAESISIPGIIRNCEFTGDTALFYIETAAWPALLQIKCDASMISNYSTGQEITTSIKNHDLHVF